MEGDCHYLEGNLNAKRRINRLKDLMEQIGLEPDRVKMYNLSSAMAAGFVDAVNEMNRSIHALGPNKLKEDG
jgi:coenzyme F420-reducing hydrogenase delta subunit